jgi:hypothetical protein
MIPWIRAGGVGTALAAIAWFVPWQVSVSPISSFGSASARTVAALIALIAGMTLARLLEWRLAVTAARRRRVEQLEQRVASLEEAMAIAPVVHLRFEYDSNTQWARLHVTNHGADGTFRAPLTIDGSLSSRLNSHVFAHWEHADAPAMPIPRGHTRTLRLAQLDVSSFPFAQWYVHATTDEGPLAVYATHTSIIGGAPDAQAPPLFLDVAILGTPQLERPCACTIILHPFDAERLRS